jgi:hypothetical protein
MSECSKQRFNASSESKKGNKGLCRAFGKTAKSLSPTKDRRERTNTCTIKETSSSTLSSSSTFAKLNSSFGKLLSGKSFGSERGQKSRNRLNEEEDMDFDELELEMEDRQLNMMSREQQLLLVLKELYEMES